MRHRFSLFIRVLIIVAASLWPTLGEAAPSVREPFLSGDVLPSGWRVDSVTTHTEYRRIALSRGGENTSVEVIHLAKPPVGDILYTTQHYRLQPAPGHEARMPLLEEMTGIMTRWEQDAPEGGFVRPIPDGLNKRNPRFLPRLFAMLGLWVALLVILALKDWRNPDSEPPREFRSLLPCLRPRVIPIPRFSGARLAATFLTVMLLALVALHFYPGSYGLQDDTTRDLQMAAKCLENDGVCPSHGPPASRLNALQHGMWIRILEGVLFLGGDIDHVFHLVRFSLAAATGLFALLVLTQFPGVPLLLACPLYFLASLHLSAYPVLWNPSLMPLALTAFFFSLVVMIRRGRVGPVIFTTLFLCFSIEFHIVNYLLAPLLLFFIGLSIARPWRGLAAFSVVAFLVHGAFSWDALLENLRIHDPSSWRSLATVVLALLAATSGALLNGVFRRHGLSRYAPELVVGTSLVISAVVMVHMHTGAASCASFEAVCSRHYLGPGYQGIVLLAAFLVPVRLSGFVASRLARLPYEYRILSVVFACLVSLAGVVAVLQRIPVAPQNSYEDARVLAAYFASKGLDYEDLRVRLHTADHDPAGYRNLVGALGLYLPPNHDKDQARDTTHIHLLAPGAAPPDDADRVDRVELPDGGTRLIAYRASWLDYTEVSVCLDYHTRRDPVSRRLCRPLALYDSGGQIACRYPCRAYPDRALRLPLEELGPFEELFQERWSCIIPLSAPPSAVRHRLCLVTRDKGWRIGAVEGLDGTLNEDRSCVTLEALEGAQGRVSLETDEPVYVPSDPHPLPLTIETGEP